MKSMSYFHWKYSMVKNVYKREKQTCKVKIICLKCNNAVDKKHSKYVCQKCEHE